MGLRQSGKTTLVKKNFPSYKYFNLEELDLREFAKKDPRRFVDLAGTEKSVILDKIQNAPELLSYIQYGIDENRRSKFFSAGFSFLMKQRFNHNGLAVSWKDIGGLNQN